MMYFKSVEEINKIKEFVMKMFLSMITVLVMFLVIACPAQVKSDYEIFGTAVTGATNYLFFLEAKPATGGYHLIQGMDYLAPNVTAYKVGEATTPVFTVNLNNDGKEYTVGIVAVNAGGFYSGMGVAVGIVGTAVSTPGGVGLRKK
jgi:hypothetical protein